MMTVGRKDKKSAPAIGPPVFFDLLGESAVHEGLVQDMDDIGS